MTKGLSASGILLAGLLACSGASGPAFADPGHGFAAGEPGNPKKLSRTIIVTMREVDGRMIFVPESIEVRRGEQIRFILQNVGETDHEFVLATTEENLKHMEEMKKNPDMEHDDPNARRVAFKKRAEIYWRFTKAGEFEFSCLMPGHREAGMTGKIVVR